MAPGSKRGSKDVSAAFSLRLADWTRDRERLAAVRRQVFVVEQAVPEDMEWDGLDETCVHVVALDPAGEAVATGRMTTDGRIGRMAVLRSWRGRGVGAAVLDRLVDEARRRHLPSVYLHAQTHALAFYARAGFVARGDEFDEAGIPHVEMSLELPAPR